MFLPENSRWRYFIVFAMAFVLYANTLYHQFVMDDDVVITGNAFVQKGLGGIPDIFTHDSFVGYQKVEGGEKVLEGGRYRPLSLVFFAMLYSLFGPDPFFFHLCSILLYALAGLLVFRWLLLLLKSEEHGHGIAFMTALMFMAHPLHTEVVANVKSTDEILALLFGIAALYSLLKTCDGASKIWYVLSFIFMMAACLAKENAITLLLVAPLSIWFFREVKIPFLATRTLPLIAGGIFFLFIRYSVLGPQPPGLMMQDPLNNPFLEWTGNAWIACSPAAKAATLLYTFGLNMRLMAFPYPLTHDYYPFHIQLQTFSNPFVWFSLFIFLFLLTYATWSILKKKREGFGIVFFLVTASVTSNIFFPVGVFMAERFLFLPSLGILLAFVFWGFRLAGQKHQKPLPYFFIAILIIFSGLTLMRNPAWKDNETLLRADIIHSPNSAKGQNDLGTNILDKALKTTNPAEQKFLLTEAYPHFLRALELHPTYYDAYLASGACAYYLGRYDQSVNAYRIVSQLYPGDTKSKTGLLYALQAFGRDQWARNDTISSLDALTEAWNMQPDTSIASELSKHYQSLGQPEKSKEWKDRMTNSFK